MQVRRAFELPMLELLRHRPEIHLPAVEELLELSHAQMAKETFPGWILFWSLGVHYFNGLLYASHRDLSMQQLSISSQLIMSGLLLQPNFDASNSASLEGLDLINRLLFLEQADVITQHLVVILDKCAQDQHPRIPENLQLEASHMAILAKEVYLGSVHEVADALAEQLQRISGNPKTYDVQISLQGAQEVSRLLLQFAIGNLHEPKEWVLMALREG